MLTRNTVVRPASTNGNCGGLLEMGTSSIPSARPWTITCQVAPSSRLVPPVSKATTPGEGALATKNSPARTSSCSPSRAYVTGTTSGRAPWERARWPDEERASSARQRSALRRRAPAPSAPENGPTTGVADITPMLPRPPRSPSGPFVPKRQAQWPGWGRGGDSPLSGRRSYPFGTAGLPRRFGAPLLSV